MGGIVRGRQAPKIYLLVKGCVEDHPNYPAKKDEFSYSKVEAMRQDKSFKSWWFYADHQDLLKEFVEDHPNYPTIDD